MRKLTITLEKLMGHLAAACLSVAQARALKGSNCLFKGSSRALQAI